MTPQSLPPAIPFNTKPSTAQSSIPSPPNTPTTTQSFRPSVPSAPAQGLTSISRPPLASRFSVPLLSASTSTSNHSPPLGRGLTMTSVPTTQTLKSTPVSPPPTSSEQMSMFPPSTTTDATLNPTSRPITTSNSATPTQSTNGAHFSATATSEPQPTPTDTDKLRNLIKDCDVFLQAYRPGGLAKKGFGPEDVAKMRPGVVSTLR